MKKSYFSKSFGGFSLWGISCLKTIPLFLVLGLFLSPAMLEAQSNLFKGTELKNKSNSTLEANFEKFTVVDFELGALNKYVRPKNGTQQTSKEVTLQMADYIWTFNMVPSPIWADDFRLLTKENGQLKEISVGPNKTFSGFVNGGSAQIYLTLDEDFLSGVIYEGGQATFFEPVSRFINGAPANQLVIYENTEVKSTGQGCGYTETTKKAEELKSQSAGLNKANLCYQIRVAIASDVSVYNHNSVMQNATTINNFTTAVFNNVQGLYRFAFADNLEFQIVMQFVSTATGNDPYTPATPSTNENTLLNNFGAWMAGNGFGTLNIDVGQVWSARGIGVGGLAFTPGTCTALATRSQIINFSGTNAGSVTCLVSHETGHNFSAQHQGTAPANIMGSGCGPLVWHPNTITEISNHIASPACTGGPNALVACQTPIAAISGGGGACVGQAVTLTDNSQYGATRTWSTPGGTPTAGTAANHTVTYGSAGMFTATLTSTNSNGSNMATASIFVGNAPAAICPPSPNAPQGTGGVSRFALANVDNTSPSGASLNVRYEDFSCTDVIKLDKSTLYNLISLVIDNSTSESWKIYIDYNGDGDFLDAGEEVMTSSATGSNSGEQVGTVPPFPVHVTSFTTPAGPVENQILRLRIITDSGFPTITPCFNPTNSGQVEDYGVVFMSAATCPTGLAASTAPAVGVTNSTCTPPATFPSGGQFAAITCPTGSTPQYSTDNGANWSATLPTYNQTTAMTVLTRCNCNSNTTISSMTGTATTVPGTCAATCTIGNLNINVQPTCSGNDATFLLSHSVMNGSGNYNLFNTANNAVLGQTIGGPLNGMPILIGGMVTGPTTASTINVNIVDANNAACIGTPISLMIPQCPPGTTCSITGITATNFSACNNNGTPTNPADDFFTATVTVAYANPPGTGNLAVSGDGTASTTVGLLGGPNTHMFNNVQMSADGGPIDLTATFTAATPPCTFTNANVATALAPCSGTGPTISQTDLNGDGNPDITDPCACGDPLNILDGGGNVTFFHDFVTIVSVTGETWEITAINSGALYNNPPLPPAAPFVVGTVIPETPPGSGVYRLDNWHAVGVGFNADFNRTAGGPPLLVPLTTGGTCNACPPQAIPTMGEWGLIILALLLLCFSTVFMMRRQTAFAGIMAPASAYGNSRLPFDRTIFMSILGYVMAGLALVFAVAVLAFGYEMTNADVPGALIAGPILAYLIHLMGLFKEEQ